MSLPPDRPEHSVCFPPQLPVELVALPVGQAPTGQPLIHYAAFKGAEADCWPVLELVPPADSDIEADRELLEFGSESPSANARRSTASNPDATAATITAMPLTGVPAVAAATVPAPVATAPVIPSMLEGVGMALALG